MNLRDEIAADTAYRPMGCSVCEWLATRPESEEWPAIMADSALGHEAIYRAMKKRGYPRASSKPVVAHRNHGHPPRGD